jgi:hypothetical protein
MAGTIQADFFDIHCIFQLWGALDIRPLCQQSAYCNISLAMHLRDHVAGVITH